MEFEISGEKHFQGVREFITVYYKEELKSGSLKKTIITYSACLLVLILLCFLTPGVRELYYYFIGLLLIVVSFIVIGISTNIIVSKKKKFRDDISKIVHSYHDSVEITTCFKDYSIDKVQYEYRDIKKIVANKNYLYLFLNDNFAIPVEKSSLDNQDQFILFMKNKGVLIK